MREKIAHLSKSRTLLTSLAAIVALAVVGTTFGYASLSKSVTLTLDGETMQVSAMGDTVADVLEAEGIEIGQHDEVAPGLGTEVDDGHAITVAFARPLELVVDGETSTHWVTATQVSGALEQIGRRFSGADLSVSRSSSIRRSGMELEVVTPKEITLAVGGKDPRSRQVPAITVEDALAELDVDVDADDRVRPALGKEIADGDRITVTRVRVVEQDVEGETIDFRTVEEGDASMEKGKEAVVREGRVGLRDVTYRLTFVNGEVSERKVLRSDVRREPRNALVKVGTKESAPAAPNYAPGNTVWDRLAACESGGNWGINTGNGYYGGLQFSAATWASVGGSGLPHQHSREEQIRRGQILQSRAGWGQWPHCSSRLGLR